LLLKSGPHGGHHGHPDKLALSGWYDGWRFSPDLGTPGYGVASLETWYRQSLSHSTLLIDGESQPPVDGCIERCRDDGAVATVAWEGVRMRRVLRARREYFIDVCEVDCVTPRPIDWIHHNAGRLELAQLPGRPSGPLTGGAAYSHLGDIAEHDGGAPGRWRWREGGHAMVVWTAAAADETVFSGTAPSNPPTERLGFLLRRRHAGRAIFLAVFHPFRDSPRVDDVEFTADGGVRVRLADRCDDWTPGQLTDLA